MKLRERLFSGWGAKSSSSGHESPAAWLIDWVRGGQKTVSGESVTPDSAMTHPALLAVVKVKSEDAGKLPLNLYQRDGDGNRRKAIEHPLYDLMRNAPNPRHTAFEFKQMIQAHKDLRGNGYALKVEDRLTGAIKELWPLPSQYVAVMRSNDGMLWYRLSIPGMEVVTYPARLIVHLRGMTLDGYTGVSPITYARETIGAGLGQIKYGAAFFGNSAQPNGALKVPRVLDTEATKLLRQSWEDKHRGAGNAHKLAIFDGGMEWLQTGMNNTDAEWIAARKLTASDIYRIYRMPPHKVGDLEKATFSNIEQQSLEYVTDCLMADLVCWEQTLARDLLTPEERAAGYYFEFNIDALLRGDFKSRMDGFAIARNWGIFSADDCREMLNMNHLPDGVGQIYLQPLNMVPAGTEPEPVKQSQDETVSAEGAKTLKGILEVLKSRAINDDQTGAAARIGQDRIEQSIRALETILANQKPADVVVNVAPQPVTLNLPEREVTVVVNAADPVTEVFEVDEHTEDGRLKKWTKTPVPVEKP